MDASLYGPTPMMTAMGRDPDLRAYARWEYGSVDRARATLSSGRAPGPSLGSRARRWLGGRIALLRGTAASPSAVAEE